jgi:hypothetical protein
VASVVSSGDSLHHRLRHKQAVERVFMNSGQAVDRNGVFPPHGQLVIIVVDQIAPKRARIDLKIVAPQSPLDCNLPETCRAEKQVVALVAEQARVPGGKRRLAAASFATAEQILNLPGSHLVEIVRDADLAFHETEPPTSLRSWRVQWHDLHERLTRFRANERPTVTGLNIHCLHQPRPYHSV